MELIILAVIVLVVNAVIKSNTQKQNAQRKLEEMKERAKIPGLSNRQEPPAQPGKPAAPLGAAQPETPAPTPKLHRAPLQTELAAQRPSAPAAAPAVMPQVQPSVLQAAPQAPLRTANAAPADTARMPVKKSGARSDIRTMDLKQMVVMKEILDKPVSRRAGRMGARR